MIRELRRQRPSSRPLISDSGRPVFLARAIFNLVWKGHYALKQELLWGSLRVGVTI